MRRTVELARRVVSRSASWALPIIAHTMVLWGLVFIAQPARRRAVPGLRTTVDSLPPWAWAVLMIAAGCAFLIFVKPWTVAVMVFVLTAYGLTLLTNALRYPDVTLTSSLWPLSTALTAWAVGARVGSRRPPGDRRRSG